MCEAPEGPCELTNLYMRTGHFARVNTRLYFDKVWKAIAYIQYTGLTIPYYGTEWLIYFYMEGEGKDKPIGNSNCIDAKELYNEVKEIDLYGEVYTALMRNKETREMFVPNSSSEMEWYGSERAARGFNEYTKLPTNYEWVFPLKSVVESEKFRSIKEVLNI